jgi:hypothetical protein
LEVLRDGERRTLEVTGGAAREGGAPPADSPAQGGQRAYLGIRMQELTAELRETFGVTGDRGVLVSEVMGDGPAGQAGLRAGDVLVGIDRKTVNDTGDVYRAMAYFDPGETVDVRVVRDREEKQLSVTLGGVAPSRFHGGYPPHTPFPYWRDRPYPWPGLHRHGPGWPPGMEQMFEHLPERWMVEPPWRGGGPEDTGLAL